MVDVWDVASPGIRTRNALHSTTLRLPWHRTQPASAVDRAFAEQYERHHQAIYRYCRSILRHDQDAQDALQATMLKALAAMQAGTVTGDLRPWLFRVAHNESISMRRRHANEAPLEAAGDLGADHLHQRVDDRAALARLQSDLEDLADRQRTALVLREFSGLGHEEIAQVLGSTPGAVKQTIFEARKALLECETGRSMTCDEIQRLLSDQDGRTLRSRKLRAHLRDCAACTAFSAAMHDRPRQLALLAPAIPAAMGAGILANVVGGGHSAAAAGGTGAAAAASGAAGTSVAAGTGAAASTIATSAGLKVAALLAAGGIAAGGGVAVKEHRSAPTAPPPTTTTTTTTTQSAPASPAGAPSTAMPGAGGATADPAAKRSGAGSPPQATTPDGAGVAGEAKGAAEAGGAGAATGPGDSDPGASAGAPGRATSSVAKSKARGTTTSASAKTKRSGTKAHAKTKSSAKPTTKGKTPKPAAATSGGAPGTDKTKPAGNSGGSSGAGGSSGTSGSSGSTAPAESGSAGGAATPPERAPAPKDPAAGRGANGSGSGPSNRSGAETPGEPQG